MARGSEETKDAGEIHPEAAPDRLTVDRVSGEYGPVVRCSGELTLQTSGILQQELDRLEPMGHAVLTVNLSGCDFIDVDGLMTLLEGYRRLRETGRRMALVAGGGIPGRLLQVLGVDGILPVFPREEVAALALRGAGPRPPAPATWEEARDRTLQRWRVIRETLAQDPEEALRLMTSMFALCDLSEDLFEERTAPAHARCQFCPLFHALGGRRQDLGCRSVLEPIVDAVRAGDTGLARSKIDGLMQTIAEMPLTEDDQTPGHPLGECVPATGGTRVLLEPGPAGGGSDDS